MRTYTVAVVIAVAFGGAASPALAQVVSFSAAAKTITVGEPFAVDLSLDTLGKSINTVSGTVVVPSALSIQEVRSGNSIISLWVTQPAIDRARGTVTFAGGVPGGFSGSRGPLLSLVLKPTTAGNFSVKVADLKVLLNDGEGTPASDVAAKTLSLAVRGGALGAPSGTKKKQASPPPSPAAVLPKTDTVPPEAFVPIVSRHESIAQNRYFVSFFAVDKDSGIARYEVREEPAVIRYVTPRFDTAWTQAKTPHVLSYQYWPSTVLVRAYDRFDNVTIGAAEKPAHPLLWTILFALGLAVSSAVTRRLTRRPRRHVILKT